MTRVVLIDGSPGAGKTHTLREKLEELKAEGLGVNDFWWLNFSNAGRRDVEPELLEVYPDANDPSADARAKTMHGLALSLVIRDGVIDPNDVGDVIIQQGQFGDDERDPFAEFCRRRGMRYNPDESDPRKLLSGEESTEYNGNKLFAINDYLTQTRRGPGDWRDAPTDIDIPSARVVELLEAWGDYKRDAFENRLFEHGDYVETAIDRNLTPAADVLLIDEFQDFAPLEYRLYREWRESGQVGQIFLAGDPRQSIYSFRGGTPYYFEETPVDDVITLKESYRCPSDIASVGTAVLSAHNDTDARGFDGKDSGGMVNWMSINGARDLHDYLIPTTDLTDKRPGVLLLTRTRYQLGEVERDLRDVGIPFEVLGSHGGVWRGEMGQILAFLNELENGAHQFPWSSVQSTLKWLPNSTQRRNAIRSPGKVVSREKLAPAIDGFDSALEIVDNLQKPEWQRGILRNAVDAKVQLEPDEVQVGTIHRAKGLEAPTVFLFTETTQNTVRRYQRNTRQAAEEHRVYYVGATRASERLHLVSDYFDGPTAPPLRKARRSGGVGV